MVIPERIERKYEPYPEYRDSGVEWLGKIPAHWEVKKLKYLCSKSAIYGANAAADSYSESGIRFLRTSDIDDNGNLIDDNPVHIDPTSVQDYRLVSGDLLVSRSGTIGRSFLYDNTQHGECAYAGYLVRFVPNKKLVPKFAFYFTKSATFQDWLQVSVIQSTIGNVNGQKYANMPMPTAEVTEQQAIADFLDRETARIDELIARKQRLIELLQEQRTALITRAVTKGINPDVPMKDSGVEWLGEIPANWEVKKLKYVVVTNPGAIKSGPFGSQILTSEMSGSDVKVYNQRNVVDQDFDAGENYITQAKYLELSSFTVYVGDILITTRGTIGRCAIVPQQAPLGILHPCLMRIQPDIKKILSNYLKIIIQDSALFYSQLQYFSNATTIDVVYTDTLKNIKIPLPPPTEQLAIIDFFNQETARIDSLVDRINRAVEKLQEYRSALITAAVTGKIDVRQHVS